MSERRHNLNLDAMNVDELKQTETCLHHLAIYCNLIGNAMRLRLEGKIAQALRYESLADSQYALLPDDWRW